MAPNSSAQVPTGTPNAAPPTPVKLLEIGKVSTRSFNTSLEKLIQSYDREVPLYIINYGSGKEIARREKLIMNPPIRWPHDRSRITLVRGGFGKGPKTVFWKIPYGADNPSP